MADIGFMQEKYTMDKLITSYMREIKALKSQIQNPLEKQKLKAYFDAVKTIKNTSSIDKGRYALSFGRHLTGKPAQIRDAIPVVLGQQVTQPQPIDLAYAMLLRDYAQSFLYNKHNLKDFVLHFLINSHLSPITSHFDREVQRVVNDTDQKIQWYQMNVSS